jgi:hypothetical protein
MKGNEQFYISAFCLGIRQMLYMIVTSGQLKHIHVLKGTNGLLTAEDTSVVEVQVEAGVPEDIIPALVPGLALSHIPMPVPVHALIPVPQGYHCFPFPMY